MIGRSQIFVALLFSVLVSGQCEQSSAPAVTPLMSEAIKDGPVSGRTIMFTLLAHLLLFNLVVAAQATNCDWLIRWSANWANQVA